MQSNRRLAVICVGAIAMVALPASAASAAPAEAMPPVFEGPVPRAECGPGSRPETGLQGQGPLADRESGRSSEGYTCNLDLVGH